MTITTTDTRVIEIKMQADDQESIKQEMGETLTTLIKQGWSITRASIGSDEWSAAPSARVEAEKIKEQTRSGKSRKQVASTDSADAAVGSHQEIQ